MPNELNKSTDQELVQRFNDGDRLAFDELVGRYAGKAYQIAFGVLGNREDSEEVAQDVFVRVYRALGKFRGDAEFSTWMYRIALNLARNKYRWNKCRGFKKHISLDATITTEKGDEMSLDLPEPRPTPDKESELAEFETRMRELVDKLSPTYREPLLLRNVEQMSYERIAETLGCKIGTVKSRIARAREQLRKQLEP
jgi:RNA polymerase sigma-70 factor (ECF subfamily)